MDELTIEKEEEKQLIFFNEALEYFNDNMIISQENNETYNRISNILREEMLTELENLKELLLNCPDIKFEALTEEQKELFEEFIKNYSKCPVCQGFNHYYNLRNLFFSENKEFLLELLRLKQGKSNKFRKLDINFGIPCCNCFKKYFQQEG